MKDLELIDILYHNFIMEMFPMNNQNHEAINTIIMAIKKIKCYKDWLMTYDPGTIKSIN